MAPDPSYGRLSYSRLASQIVDHWLPTLRDTESRLLFVVLRQTIGRGKADDWLSHSQLKRRTGRASEAVSAAICALVDRRLIEVHASSGQALVSTAQRQRERGALHFRLGPALVGPALPGSAPARQARSLVRSGTGASPTNRPDANQPDANRADAKSKTTERVCKTNRSLRNSDPGLGPFIAPERHLTIPQSVSQADRSANIRQAIRRRLEALDQLQALDHAGR